VPHASDASSTRRERWLVALAVLVLGAASRLPFLAESLAVPVDGDTGVVGLMALDRAVSGTMWGQPYGSPVESWLVLPFVELLGPTRLALRLAYFVIGLGLVPLAFGLARALHSAAGLPAALVLACPPTLLLAWSAVPQPLYPATLVLVATSLLAALATESRLADGAGGYRIPLALWSACGALAVWTHFVSVLAVIPGAALLAWRVRRVPRRLCVVLAALAVALVPAFVLLSAGSGSEGVLAASLHHARAVVPRMHLALIELVGGRTGAVADADPEIVSPAWAQVALALGYAVGALGALRSPRRGAALMLWAVVVLMALAFPFPLRSDPTAVRFLAPAYLPLAALAAAGAASRSPRTAWALAALLAVLHLLPAPALVDSWRRGAHASPFSPDCTAARTAMEVLGVRRGYASYNTAYCITYESGRRIVVSQPWNERFSASPLPYLDEVRFATAAVWILSPGTDFGMPSPERLESLLRAAGGTWRRWDREGFVLYHSFVAPFPDTVEEAGVRRCDQALTLPLPRPEAVGGITVLARPGGALPERLSVETSLDGRHFETVWSRRRPRALAKLVWLGGHPRYAIDPAAVAVLVPGGRPISGVRVTTPGADACTVIGPVLLHRPSPGPVEADWIGLDTSWPERRRILAERPLPNRATWHYRKLVAAAHRQGPAPRRAPAAPGITE
jgi:hypothetical protein